MGYSKVKIRESNEEQFFFDVKRCRQFAVYCAKTETFFIIRKLEVMKTAERSEIRYYVTDKIFVVKRNVMVII